MPARDGTGPLGAGKRTGRGLGGCASAAVNDQTLSGGFGCRCRAGRSGMHGRGAGRAAGASLDADAHIARLRRQRDTLQKRIDEVEQS